MDQDSFRQLLASSSSSSSTSQTRNTRESLFTQKSSAKAKPTTIGSNEVAFKPRKVKKTEERYRDRAAERREGEGNDYAQVEAVLEEFEKRTADQDANAVEEQRRYLGGDSEHSVLVKGLDMALLEQNKAKASMATDEDDSLEKAYIQSSHPTVPKKRTREDIIRELKEKRAQGGEAAAATEDPSLNRNKFKPIGFKPIGGSGEKTEKKKKAKGDGERKKKKRKVEDGAVEIKAKAPEVDSNPAPSSSSPKADTLKPPLPPPEPAEPEPPEDFDIFAGAGEYEGVDIGDDDEEEDEEERKRNAGETEEVMPLGPGRWFAGDEPEASAPPAADPPPVPKTSSSSLQHHSGPPPVEDGEASEEEQPMRLVPLASSALPSIKDLLAMDDAAGSPDKKRKKKKGGKDGSGPSKKLDAEAKANRDYQRLKSYTDKRGDASK